MLGDGALLAITIENPTPSGEPMRYQGLVELGAPSLAEALEGYFTQSEQLPTRFWLRADGQRLVLAHAAGRFFLAHQRLPFLSAAWPGK